jgi:type II secretory pathway pseudopilin PulG
MISKSGRRRPGAHLVESTIVFSITMVLLAGLVVSAMGIARYQATAQLAREAARYASMHGGQYQKDNAAAITNGDLPDVTSDYITKNIVKAQAVDLDPTQLTTTINFNMSSGSFDWDDTAHNGSRWPYSQKTISGTTYSETNTVSVTVTYQWSPEWFFGGTITLSSTSVMPMCY